MNVLSAASCVSGPEEGRGNKSTDRQCSTRGEMLSSFLQLTSEDINELLCQSRCASLSIVLLLITGESWSAKHSETTFSHLTFCCLVLCFYCSVINFSGIFLPYFILWCDAASNPQIAAVIERSQVPVCLQIFFDPWSSAVHCLRNRTQPLSLIARIIFFRQAKIIFALM